MECDPNKHHRPFGNTQGRRSIRLKGWDYSRPGAYFVTVCTQNRKCLFGEIKNDEMELNGLGQVVWDRWNRIPYHFKHVQLDVFQIMLNHIHGILFIVDVGAKHSEIHNREVGKNQIRNASPLRNRPHGTQPGSLSAIMQNFLSVSIRNISQIRQTLGDKVWQRNYYDHIIRNENGLNQIRDYITGNPSKWDLDKENPANWKRGS